MKNKGILYWIIYILLLLWQLPQYLVALVMWPFLGKKTKVAERHFNACFVGEKMSGGISLGPIAYVSKRLVKYSADVCHELDGHTVQSKILGPFYLLIRGLPSIIHAWLYDYKKTCYYDFYTERWANKAAKLYSTNYCGLIFEDEDDERNINYA